MNIITLSDSTVNQFLFLQNFLMNFNLIFTLLTHILHIFALYYNLNKANSFFTYIPFILPGTYSRLLYFLQNPPFVYKNKCALHILAPKRGCVSSHFPLARSVQAAVRVRLLNTTVFVLHIKVLSCRSDSFLHCMIDFTDYASSLFTNNIFNASEIV